MASPGRITAQLRRLDWARGLRAGLAVAAAMVVCRMLGLPMGWSALGAFEGNIVDNGGPYRVRFISIAMLMAGGSLGAVLASLASPHLAWTLVLTAVFSFVITYLRAASPALTTSSVIILVVYFVGIDHPSASLAGALSQAGLFLGGCAFAAILSLFLWPVYPFGHARRVIALCFGVLAQSLAEMDALLAEADAAKDQGSSWTARWFSVAQGFPNRMRSALEAARTSLGSVRARTPARSARGRNLAVLLEIADILFSRGLAMVDLAERSAIEGNAEDIALARQRLAWLGQAALLVERGLGDRASVGRGSPPGQCADRRRPRGQWRCGFKGRSDVCGCLSCPASGVRTAPRERARSTHGHMDRDRYGLFPTASPGHTTPGQGRAAPAPRVAGRARVAAGELDLCLFRVAPRPAHLGGLRIQRAAGTGAASALRRVDGVYRSHRSAALRGAHLAKIAATGGWEPLPAPCWRRF